MFHKKRNLNLIVTSSTTVSLLKHKHGNCVLFLFLQFSADCTCYKYVTRHKKRKSMKATTHDMLHIFHYLFNTIYAKVQKECVRKYTP